MRRRWALVPAIAAVLLATAAQAAPGNGDPAERMNRVGFAIYQALDRHIVRPAALAYQHALPERVRRSMENVLNNLHEPVVAANDLLQGRFGKARAAVVRLVVNSTGGVLGLFDVAARLGVPPHDNGFALTLGRAGVRPGPYLFIPIAGPSTVRDTIGNGVDRLMDPFQWFLGARLTTVFVTRTLVSGLDERASADPGLQALLADATDPYATLRSVYLQNQQAKIDDRPANATPVLPAFDDDSAPTSQADPAVEPGANLWVDGRLADTQLNSDGFAAADTEGTVEPNFVRGTVGVAVLPVLALSAAAYATPAAAQTTPTPAAAAQGATAQSGLPTVIVQARRVPEQAEHVPVADTALGTHELREDTVTQVSDLAKNVPSFEVDPGSLGGAADPVFTIRGLSGALVADPAVVSYFDEVALDPRNFAYSMYDLGSVEVLKGPQGTLFGKNSTGGAVTFAPMRPGPAYGGYLDARYGNFNDREFTGVVNIPITDQVSARIAANDEQRDGIVKSVTGGPNYDDRSHYSVRGELLVTPNSHYENDLEATAYSVREVGAEPTLTAVAPCMTGAEPQCFFEFPADLFLGTKDLNGLLAQQRTLSRDRTVNNFQSPFDVDFDAVTDIATIHWGPVTIKNIAHADNARYHIAFDLTGTGAGLLDEDDFQNNRNYSDELQLLGQAFNNRLSWIVGGYYNNFTQNEHETFDEASFPGNPLSPQVIRLNEPQTSKALFGQATLDISDWLHGVSVTGGYRYTWDNRSFTQSRFQPGGIVPIPFPPGFMVIPSCALAGFPGLNPATCVEHLSTQFSNYNYNVSVNWQATSNLLIYVASRRGYKAGGFNFASLDPAFIAYAPETVTDVEAGLKADWNLGDVPVRTNIAIYDARYDDIQNQVVTVGPTGQPEAIIVNRDPLTGTKNRATLKGGEFEVTVVPFKELRVSGFYGFATGTYDQFIDSTRGVPISLAGQDISGIAHTTGGVTIDYQPTLGDRLGSPEFVANIYSRSTLSSNLLNPGLLGGYTNVDLRLDWRSVGGRPVDIAIYGNNVTDDRHVAINNDLLNVVGVQSEQFAEPATFGVEVRYRFGAT
jgi:iron complex outermembrane receptor protein